jgi:hypothetical protein
LRDQIRSLLQLQQVRTHACRESYVRHLVYPFPIRLFDVPFLKRIFLSPSIFPEYWSQLITLTRKLPVKKDN